MFMFYDLETTGLNPFHCKITELCFIKQIPLDFNEQKFITLINPEEPISPIVTKITGIDDIMVNNKPKFGQVSQQLLHFINGEKQKVYFIAHNNDGYDKLVLTSHFKRIGIDIKKFQWVFLDTLLIAKKMYPQLKKYNLKSLCQHFKLEVLEAHRAEADTLMLKHLFYRMIKDLPKVLGISLDSILKNPQIIYDFIN